MYKIVKDGKISYKATLSKYDKDAKFATFMEVKPPNNFHPLFNVMDLGNGHEEDGVWITGTKLRYILFNGISKPLYFNVLKDTKYNPSINLYDTHKLVLKAYATKSNAKIHELSISECDSDKHWNMLTLAAMDYKDKGENCSPVSKMMLLEGGTDNEEVFANKIISKAEELARKTATIRCACKIASNNVSDEGTEEEQVEKFVQLFSQVIDECESIAGISLEQFV